MEVWNLKIEKFEFFQYFKNEESKEKNAVGDKEIVDLDEKQEESKVLDSTLKETEVKETMEITEGASSVKSWLEETPMNVPQEIIDEARQEADEIMRKVAMDASEIMNAAKQRAAETREEARAQGYQAGYDEGKEVAIKKVEEEYRFHLKEKYAALLEGLYGASLQIEKKKKEMQEQYLKQMSDMTIAIAEKVINISLKSSAEVVERMILSALETSSAYQWARVRISAEDAKRMQEAGVNLEFVLHHVAERVKVVVIENAPPGTCYVEFPDQIIDASAQTQLQNIRTLVDEIMV